MKLSGHSMRRRFLLASGVATTLAWLSGPLLKPTHAQQQIAAIVAVSVAKVPDDPEDPLWSQAEAVYVPLNPQNLVVPRLKEAGAKAVNVRALYDAGRIGFLLEWLDAHKDVDLGTVLQYRDAVAIQFPEDPSRPTPSFTMGQKDSAVTIYHWISDWQFGQLHDVDEAYPNMYGDWYPFSGVPAGEIPEATDYLTTGQREYLTAAAVGNALADPQAQEKLGPVHKMRAAGFGTIEPDGTQDARGLGVWRDGGWRIAISVPRKQAKFTFEEGAIVPLAFAVWDGSRNERNGQKAYSYWNNMNVGAPAPVNAPTAPGEVPGVGRFLVPLLSGIGGLAVVLVAVLIGLRLWRGRRRQV